MATDFIDEPFDDEERRLTRVSAKATGLPYQTLINSVIHRYVTGALVPKAPIRLFHPSLNREGFLCFFLFGSDFFSGKANGSVDKDCKSMYIVDMRIRFDKDKATKVLEEHGVEMDDVRNEILEGRFAVDEVSNQAGHPGQRMFVVIVDGYACCAPYVVESDGTYFLKTAFKNRTYQRRYENGEFEIPV